MTIYDCFSYWDEDLLLDLRLSILDKFVDYFVIVESSYTHKGEKRDLKFNINKFSKYKEKIIYLTYDIEPQKISKIDGKESENQKSGKYIMNAIYRENGQRNYISEGIKSANNNDIILISDVDEIPNLSEKNLKSLDEKIFMFQQEMFYYKFNLKIPNIIWTGTRGCKKKYLKSPQWLRNIKPRKFSPFRLDILFSERKYANVKIFQNGGWHFTNIKPPEEIEKKLKSYLHHREFDLNPLSLDEIKKIITEKRAIYDLSQDQRKNKIGRGEALKNVELFKLPSYIQENKNLLKNWLD